MGVAGTEVTRAAVHMILNDEHFATIVLAVREGRGVLDNIRKFLRYLLSSNLAKATLNKSLAARASLLWAVCGLANPRHSLGYGCGLRLASHPKPGRPHSRGLIQLT